MNLRDAAQKAGQILAEERIAPTVAYELQPRPSQMLDFTPLKFLFQKGKHFREIA